MNKYNWNFKDFFKSDDDFQLELEKLELEIETFNKELEKLSLYDLLKKYYNLSLQCEKLLTYAELNSDLDMSNQKYLNFKSLVYNKKIVLDSIKDIINQKILLIDETLDEYLQKYPELKEYKMHLYEVLRLKEHNKKDKGIQNATTMILKMNDLYNTIQNVELEYKKIKIDRVSVIANKKNYSKYLLDSNQSNRRKIFNGFTNSLAKVNKSVSGLLNARLKSCYDVATLKNYNTIIEQALNEDGLNIEIINNLIKSVNDNFVLLERYFLLKKRSLGLSVLNPYDLKLSSASFTKNCSFEESLEIIKQSLLIMGKDYNLVLEEVLQNGCLDVYSKQNKFLGGYHWRNYTKPMILMNCNDDFLNAYIITHELGHAVNGLMIKNKRSFQDFHFSVFLSEIASKVNENILDDYLIKKASTSEEKKCLLEQKLSNFVDSIFFQTMYLEFELELCKFIESEKSLNAEIINNTFYNIYRKYFSSEKVNEKVKYLWQTRLHLFYGQYRYYNFQYATGFISALKIANDITNSKNNMLNQYLEFLTIGGSKPTLESLKATNVDFSNITVFNEAMTYFSNLLDEYESML